MKLAVEYLIRLNEEQKKWYKDALLQTSHVKNKYCLTLQKKKGSIYLVDKLGNDYIKLKNLSKLRDILRDSVYHITNISKLKEYKELYSYYLTGKDKIDIHKNFNLNYTSYRIIRVDNLEDFVTRGLLTGKIKILLNNYFYMLIEYNKTDLMLISDIQLGLGTGVELEIPPSVKKVVIENLDISNKTNLIDLFHSCYCLETVVLKNFDTRNVRSFNRMFFLCTNLKSITIDEIKTDSAEDLGYMFYGCKELKELNLNHFNVSKVVNFEKMFAGCKKLETLRIDDWVINNVETLNISLMFFECDKLKSIGNKSVELLIENKV